MTVCNMTIEAGARALLWSMTTTIEYVKGGRMPRARPGCRAELMAKSAHRRWGRF